MIVGSDQKLAVILADDDTGTAALNLLLSGKSVAESEVSVIILNFLHRLGGDGYNEFHRLFRDIGNIQASFGLRASGASLVLTVGRISVRFFVALGLHKLRPVIFLRSGYHIVLIPSGDPVHAFICACRKSSCKHCTDCDSCSSLHRALYSAFLLIVFILIILLIHIVQLCIHIFHEKSPPWKSLFSLYVQSIGKICVDFVGKL